jgi:DeoD family purine-nucleoside phosphorylase
VSDVEPLHLRPTAALSERVLLPGDPGRALMLAQSMLDQPRMFNHHRGLWGYTGAASDGRPLTIQATGMGGPSAAIVLAELIGLGARSAIRVGSCGALAPQMRLGELVIAGEAICADGTSQALGAGKRAVADAALTDGLRRAAPRAHHGPVLSVDLFYDEHLRPPVEDAIAIEMEAAALFALGARMDVAVACVLTVSDTFESNGARRRIADEALLESSQRMGQAAVQALAGLGELVTTAPDGPSEGPGNARRG